MVQIAALPPENNQQRPSAYIGAHKFRQVLTQSAGSIPSNSFAHVPGSKNQNLLLFLLPLTSSLADLPCLLSPVYLLPLFIAVTPMAYMAVSNRNCRKSVPDGCSCSYKASSSQPVWMSTFLCPQDQPILPWFFSHWSLQCFCCVLLEQKLTFQGPSYPSEGSILANELRMVTASPGFTLYVRGLLSVPAQVAAER